MYYYWLNTEYYYGDYSVPKFALIRGERNADGSKNMETEEVILWAAYEDVPGAETDDNWETIDAYIEDKLGFVPDYEVN